MNKLYKKIESGKIVFWQITQNGNQFYTETGQLPDGKVTTTKPTTVKGKNLGRSNETSDIQQCEKEVLAKYALKLKEGYFETEEEAKGSGRFEVMLAVDYKKCKDKIEFPALHDNKLDGMRCYITKDGMFSRLHNPINCAPHIWNSIKEMYVDGDPHMIVDGELYNHILKNDFDKIISLCKKSKTLTEENLKESEKFIEFHCYDYYNKNHPDLTCTERRSYLKTTLENMKHVVVPTLTLCSNQKQLNECFEKAKEAGYEGQIIRRNVPYKQIRSLALIKRKEFVDAEYLITDVTEGKGNRSGMAGKVWLVTEEGEKFEADFSELGGHEAYKRFLLEKDQIIGKMGTIVYKRLSPRGVPIHGKLKAIRDYE